MLRTETARLAALDQLEDRAIAAFVTAFAGVDPSAPTWCVGWSARETAAHVGAADAECADLVEEHLAGKPTRPTRTWDEREQPYRAMPGEQLRDALISNAIRFQRATAAMDVADTIVFTGWTMSAKLLRTHSSSEAAVHRWDLVGADRTSVELLSDPVLTRHVVTLFTAIPELDENTRWMRPSFASEPLRLRAAGQPDVLVTPGSGLSLVSTTGTEPVIELAPHDRLLVLWGRCPSALRSTVGDPETVDDLLARLTASPQRAR